MIPFFSAVRIYEILVRLFVGLSRTFANAFRLQRRSRFFHWPNNQQEQLSTDPPLPVERWTMPETGNRYLRVIAQPGDLRLRYDAEVVLEPRVEDPAT